jgi:hypothetical protein
MGAPGIAFIVIFFLPPTLFPLFPKGPWAPFEDEKTEAKPTEEQMVVLEEYSKVREAQKAAKRAGRQAEHGEKRDIEGGAEDEMAAKRALVREEETTVLHRKLWESRTTRLVSKPPPFGRPRI